MRHKNCHIFKYDKPKYHWQYFDIIATILYWKYPFSEEDMMGSSIPTAKLLIGLGILGRLLQSEQPVVALRRALEARGFSNNEISAVFGVLREERIRGVKVNIRQENKYAQHWSLVDETFQP